MYGVRDDRQRRVHRPRAQVAVTLMGPAAKNDHLAALEAQVAEKRRLNEQNAARDKQELLHHYANYSLGADDGCVLFASAG